MEKMNCRELSEGIGQMRKLNQTLKADVEARNAAGAKIVEKQLRELYENITDRIMYEDEQGRKIMGYEYKAVRELNALNSKSIEPEYADLYTFERELSAIHTISPEGHIIEWTPNIGLYIEDISPISKLTHIKKLDFMSNRLSDISPLAELKTLEWLEVKSRNLSDISPLRNCHNLNRLNINGTAVSDLEPLAGLENFESLYCFDAEVADISPLKKSKSLRFFHFGSFEKEPLIRDVSTLAEMHDLMQVSIDKVLAKDFSYLKEHAGLISLDIYDSQIEQIELHPDAKLHQVKIINCGLKDLSFLANQPELVFLILKGNPIESIEEISDNQSLRQIDVENTQVGDLSPLLKLKNLQVVKIKNNPQLRNNLLTADIISVLTSRGVKFEQ